MLMIIQIMLMLRHVRLLLLLLKKRMSRKNFTAQAKTKLIKRIKMIVKNKKIKNHNNKNELFVLDLCCVSDVWLSGSSG